MRRAVILSVLLLMAGTSAPAAASPAVAAHRTGGRSGHGSHVRPRHHPRFSAGRRLFFGPPLLYYDSFYTHYYAPYPYYVPYPYAAYPYTPDLGLTPQAPESTSYGLLQLSGVPDGATVELDGRFWLYAQQLGQRWLAVSDGRHTISVHARGSEPVERVVDVESGKNLVVDFGLT